MRHDRPPYALLAAMTLALLAGTLASPVRAEDRDDLEAVQAAVAAGRRDLEVVVRTLLRSDDDRSVCWGATYARELSLETLIPELTDVLRAYVADKERVSFRTLFATFDALLDFDAVLDPDALLPFTRPGRGTAAAVALAIRGGHPHVVLSMFESLDDRRDSWSTPWIALGNQLAGKRRPAFFLRVLAGLDVELEVTVIDSDEFDGFGASFGFGSGDGRYPQVEGYPRVWTHDLSLSGRDGDVLLANGPTPVFLRRKEVRVGHGSSSRDIDRVTERLAWIAALLRRDVAKLPLRTNEPVFVDWSDAASLRREVTEAKAKIQAAFRALCDRVRAASDIPPADVEALPDVAIRVTVKDERQDQTEPLPTLE